MSMSNYYISGLVYGTKFPNIILLFLLFRIITSYFLKKYLFT